uniref:Uncharacterized protein n=1 Tax=Rhizophora mucronata TaxID=61149 RepID=A0A2P2P2P0_RHIMU
MNYNGPIPYRFPISKSFSPYQLFPPTVTFSSVLRSPVLIQLLLSIV